MSIALKYRNEDILYSIQKSLVLLSNVNKDLLSKETAPNYWICWIFGLKSQSKYLFLIPWVNLTSSVWEGAHLLNSNNTQNAYDFFVIAFSDARVCLKQQWHIFLKSSFLKHFVGMCSSVGKKVIMTIQSLLHSISSLSGMRM